MQPVTQHQSGGADEPSDIGFISDRAKHSAAAAAATATATPSFLCEWVDDETSRETKGLKVSLNRIVQEIKRPLLKLTYGLHERVYLFFRVSVSLCLFSIARVKSERVSCVAVWQWVSRDEPQHYRKP
ncbi:hypothetical protein E2C01_015607 [Portunus trituberculatus]|uniref:Uncharacterized protein n=1 Tax=Portunus trituberculatus TaxID=210409 RepID=A0A5B7DM56_PORTR|nr:hypothetical protein [Portunus trituberculatus]